MPRTLVTPQQVTSAGVSPTFEAANVLGNSVALAYGRCIRVKNASGSAVTVTIPTPGTIDGLAITDRTINVPATTGDVMIALGKGDAYRNTDGTAYIDYSAVTSVTVAVVDVP
jgi:hypothetical protein